MRTSLRWIAFAVGFAAAFTVMLSLRPRWNPAPDSGTPLPQHRKPTEVSLQYPAQEQESSVPRREASDPRAMEPITFPIAPSILKQRIYPQALVPNLNARVRRILGLSPDEAEIANQSLSEAVEAVKLIEARHHELSTDADGNRMITILSWIDKAAPVRDHLEAELSNIMPAGKARYLAHEFVAPAFGNWGEQQWEIAFREEEGARVLTRTIIPSAPSDKTAPLLNQVTPFHFDRQNQEIEKRFGHILPLLSG